MREFLLLPVVLVLALSACARSEADPAPKQAAPAARIPLVTATEAATRDTITLTGELAADQRSDITADTQGRVLAVLARRGQHVKRGEPLVRLDVRTAALSTREAHANLAAAKSDEQLAATECGRSSSLYEKGAITKSEADREAAHCASATQKVAAAEARAALLANGISDGIVRAPFDGIVAAKNVATGEWVAPGRSLLTLVDDGALRVELAVPEALIGAIRLGQEVELSTVSRPGTYRATITRLG